VSITRTPTIKAVRSCCGRINLYATRGDGWHRTAKGWHSRAKGWHSRAKGWHRQTCLSVLHGQRTSTHKTSLCVPPPRGTGSQNAQAGGFRKSLSTGQNTPLPVALTLKTGNRGAALSDPAEYCVANRALLYDRARRSAAPRTDGGCSGTWESARAEARGSCLARAEARGSCLARASARGSCLARAQARGSPQLLG